MLTKHKQCSRLFCGFANESSLKGNKIPGNYTVASSELMDLHTARIHGNTLYFTCLRPEISTKGQGVHGSTSRLRV